MMIAREPCVTSEELTELLSGRLPSDRFEQTLQHVDSCPDCSKAIEALPLPGQFSWRARADETSSQPSFVHEPECQAVMGQLLLQPGMMTGETGPLPVDTLGPYRLLKWLGSGGMGAVYLAEHQRLKRLSAIKLLPREKLLQSDWLVRFNREMTSIAALEHPHVVRAIDAGDQAGWHYLVMEYLDGADLSKVCRSLGPLPISTACELIRQAALGLAAIHAQGMTHRDIKPSNMFLTRGGIVKLLDLGLVLSGDSPLAADERLTTVGHLMGTLPYMAREQLLDASEVDWRADIYSLGATLFRMLTGHAPLGSSKNIALTIQAITTSDCPPIESLLPEIPRELAQLVNAMLSHDRTKRPQSADGVARLLSATSDANSPVPLIRTALSQLSSAAEASHDMHSLVPARAQNSNPNKPPSRRAWWVAAALLPIAFLAGIVITVATDKGTLVIESEQPGVTLKVTQGEKIVESLRVENQPGVVRLYSGKYIVELVGADGDGLELSDSQVIVTRGQKQVLHVHKKQPSESPAETLDTGKSYQGKSLTYWMEMLDREKDVEMIGQAMQAVALLAETDAEKLAAAKKSLLPARSLGGFIITGRPTAASATNLSGWYMKEFIDNFAGLLPEPGLQATIEELEQGDERSAAACFMMLSLYANRLLGSTFGTDVDVKLSEHLTKLAETPRGREQLERLDKACEKWVEKLDSPVKGMAINVRLALCELLNKRLSEQPQLIAWAQLQLAEADLRVEASDSIKEGVLFDRVSLPASEALKIAKVLKDEHRLSLILGLLEKTNTIPTDLDHQLTETLRSMAERYPQETYEAVVKHLVRCRIESRASSMGMQSMNFAPPTIASPQRAALAKQLLLDHSNDALGIVKLLVNQIAHENSSCILAKADMADLLLKLALRLERESAADETPASQFKDAVAIYILSTFDSPANVDEYVTAIVAKDREFMFGEHRPNGNRLSKITMSQFLQSLETTGPSNFVEVVRCNELPRLMWLYQEQFVRAFIKRLEAENYEPSQVLDPLFPALNFRSEPDRQLDHRVSVQTSNSQYDEFVQSPLIGELEMAHRRALQSYLSRARNKGLAPNGLGHLVYKLIALNQFLRRDIHGEPFVKEGLDLLFERAVAPDSGEYVACGLLLYYGQHFGYTKIPFALLKAAQVEIAESNNSETIRKFVYQLYKSRPDEFCEYFTKDLEQSADLLDEAAKTKSSGEMQDAAMKLYGGLRGKNGRWYDEICVRLITNEATKARAVEAYKRVSRYLPKDLADLWSAEAKP